MIKFIIALFVAKIVKLKIHNMSEITKYARKCNFCEKGMNEGYVIEDGEEYFCGDICLLKKYTKNEVDILEIGGNNSSNYYTEWEEIDNEMYYDVNGKEYDDTIPPLI